MSLFNFELAPCKPKQNLFVFVGKLVESLVNVKIMFHNHPKKSHLRIFCEVRVSALVDFILEIIDLRQVTFHLTYCCVHKSFSFLHFELDFSYLTLKILFWQMHSSTWEVVTNISNFISNDFTILEENEKHTFILNSFIRSWFHWLFKVSKVYKGISSCRSMNYFLESVLVILMYYSYDIAQVDNIHSLQFLFSLLRLFSFYLPIFFINLKQFPSKLNHIRLSTFKCIFILN